MHARLRAYADAVRAERSDAALALSVLDKRALSSARALADSVDRRLAALDADANPGAIDEQLALPFDFSGELTSEDEPPRWPEELRLADPARDRRLLQAVAAAARVAVEAESKIGALVRWLRRTNERALVFTEYRDTLRHVAASVAAAVDRRVLILHGGMTRDERSGALRSFAREPRAVLVATDAAGEGLNLHDGCRLVVNLELPWNPMRLEQRIGRVDRLGQRRVVHALHLVARDTGEAALLARLESRVAEARWAIGAPDPLGRADDDVATSRIGENLEAAGRDEKRRALDARRLLGQAGDGAHADEPRPLVAAASTGARRQLRGRRLEIWRADAEDGCGRIAESHIVALTVARDIESVDAAVTAALAGWRTGVERNTASFVAARVRRDTAVASSRGTVDRYQPSSIGARPASTMRRWRRRAHGASTCRAGSIPTASPPRCRSRRLDCGSRSSRSYAVRRQRPPALERVSRTLARRRTPAVNRCRTRPCDPNGAIPLRSGLAGSHPAARGRRAAAHGARSRRAGRRPGGQGRDGGDRPVGRGRGDAARGAVRGVARSALAKCGDRSHRTGDRVVSAVQRRPASARRRRPPLRPPPPRIRSRSRVARSRDRGGAVPNAGRPPRCAAA